MKLSFIHLCICGAVFLCLDACKPTPKQYNGLIDSLLQNQPKQFEHILKNQDKYQVQILYTQIDRNAQQQPQFTTHRWNVDTKRYFYPASTVKFPAAVLALERLNKLNIKGLNKYTPVRFDSLRHPQQNLIKDTSAKSGIPTIAHLAKQIFIVSDNEAYNRIFEFLGQTYMQNTFKAKGFNNTKIATRLEVGFNKEENLYTSPVTFYNDQDTVYHQPALVSKAYPTSILGNIQMGKAYQKKGKIIEEPMNFTDYNYCALEDLQEFIKAVMFPQSVAPSKRFQLTNDDYQFLYQVMSEFPKESKYPNYKDKWDSYGKFLLWGNSKKPMPSHLRIFNKVGLAYGFLIDTAYIVDFEKGIEFMLTAMVFVNDNLTFNDNKYEYEKVGIPFLHNLGQAVYKYEQQRTKKIKPDLSRFKVKYN